MALATIAPTARKPIAQATSGKDQMSPPRLKSGLYHGLVRHARPGKHKLRYRIFMMALDLDEIDAIARRFRFFTHNRPGLMAFYDRDHASYTNAPVKPQIEAKLRDAGIPWDDGEIMLLCMPRLMGYVFNPVCVYFCRRSTGELAALVYEAHNTFGDRHFYVLPASEAADGSVSQACAKEMYVSPFLHADLRYEFRITPPREQTIFSMVVRRGADIALTASFAGQRQELTDRALVGAFASNPLMTFMTIVGIHWEALKMFAKGVRYLGRGREPKFILDTLARQAKADAARDCRLEAGGAKG